MDNWRDAAQRLHAVIDEAMADYEPYVVSEAGCIHGGGSWCDACAEALVVVTCARNFLRVLERIANDEIGDAPEFARGLLSHAGSFPAPKVKT